LSYGNGNYSIYQLSLLSKIIELLKSYFNSSLSQSMKNQWYGGMLAEDSSDEDQDTIKVFFKILKYI
jgi:hypothetical protein